MKKLVLITLLITMAAGTAMAQGMGGNGNGAGGGNGKSAVATGGPGNQLDRLTEVLGLDADQVAALTVTFADVQVLREQEQEQQRLFAEEMRETIHAAIVAVLTPEQLALFEDHQAKRAEFKAMLDEMRQARGGAGGNGGGRGNGTGDCTGS